MMSCVRMMLVLVGITCGFQPSVSAEELAAGPAPIISSRPRMVVTSENCPKLPPLQEQERLLLYSTYEGAALSSTAIGDLNKEFNVADIFIESGEQPLYLILSSSVAVIWRFSGDVRRVSKLFVSTRQKLPSGSPATGVVGVDRDKVSFAGDCLRAFSTVESIAGARARGDIRQMLGRESDHVSARYQTAVVSLPSMAELPTPADQKLVPPDFEASLWRDVLRFWPSGLAKVDPNSVVSIEEAVSYDVLPSQAGLAQLTGSGALRRLEDSNEFKIVKPIARFPAGMGGSHSAKFLLAKGVPYPPGDPVHSCVVSEQSGEVLSSIPQVCGH